MSDKEPKKKKKREIMINGASLDALALLVDQLLALPNFKPKLKTKIIRKNTVKTIWWRTEGRMQKSLEKAESIVDSFLDQACENGNVWKVSLNKGYKQGQCHVLVKDISRKNWEQPEVMFDELVYNTKSKNWVPKFVVSPKAKPGTYRVFVGSVRIAVDLY